MRGSISNDGFSEAFTQEEEAGRQAGLCTTGFWGGGVVGALVGISWCLLQAFQD